MQVDFWGDTLSDAPRVTPERTHRRDGATLYGTIDILERRGDGCGDAVRPSFDTFVRTVEARRPGLLRRVTAERVEAAWTDLPSAWIFRPGHVDAAVASLEAAAAAEEAAAAAEAEAGGGGGGDGAVARTEDARARSRLSVA